MVWTRAWTKDEIATLRTLAEAGHSDEAIRQRIGRTRAATQTKRARLGIKHGSSHLLTAKTIAGMLGIKTRPPVRSWMRKGLLHATPVPDWGRAQGREAQRWSVTGDDLMEFLKNPAHWHRWRPERITDDELRRWALDLQGDDRFLSMSEVAAQFGVHRLAAHRWASTGVIPATRFVNWMVRERDLVGFVPPHARQD